VIHRVSWRQTWYRRSVLAAFLSSPLKRASLFLVRIQRMIS